MECCRWLLILLAGLSLEVGIPSTAQENQTTPLQTDKNHRAKHLASKDDVQSIGSRNIGGKRIGNWYSVEKEIDVGREYSRAIEEHAKILTDPIVIEYVNRIGQNLVRNSDATVPFTIKVIDSEEVNAFALPGGFLDVNAALLMIAQGEAELAAAMAHEIAHVAAHHATRQMTHEQMFDLATIPLIFIGGGLGVAVREVVGLATPLSLIRFSRSFEREADYLGVEYLYMAGYDPQAFVSFFERIQALEKQKPGTIAKMFSSHPQTQERIRKTQTEIAMILPPRDTYVISTSEFDDVQSHLSALESQRTRRERDPDVPTLRRRVSADRDGTEEDGEPPTLMHRSER